MCLPVAQIALTVISGLGQMYSQQQQAKAQAKAYDAQAQAAEFNKRLSDRKQEQIAENALTERRKLDDKRRLVGGQIAASAGSSGLTLSGSPLDILSSSESQYQRDVDIWDQNKNNDIYNEYLNGVNYQNQANAARASAANVRSQAKTAAMASILGMATSIYGLKAQQAGAVSQMPQGNTRQLGSLYGSSKLNPGTFYTPGITTGGKNTIYVSPLGKYKL